MDYKGQTTVLSIILLVGMIFLVPAITEKALAVTRADAAGRCGPEGATHPCQLTLLDKFLKSGIWTRTPNSGISVTWDTIGVPL